MSFGRPDGLKLQLRSPWAWLLDLANHYHSLYGERGDGILQRVLTELLPVEPLH